MGGNTVGEDWQHRAVVTCSGVHISPTGLEHVFLRLLEGCLLGVDSALHSQLSLGVDSATESCTALSKPRPSPGTPTPLTDHWGGAETPPFCLNLGPL